MRSTIFTMATILILFLATLATGQTTLDNDDALAILKELTSKKPTTWLSAGTIKAKHTEYQAAETTDESEVEQAIEAEVEDYQESDDRIEQASDLQKSYIEAIPFNVRYEMTNEYTMKSTVVVKYDGEKFYWEIDATSRTDSVTPSSSLQGNEMLDYFDMSMHASRTFVWDGQQYILYSASANHALIDAADELPQAINGPLTAGVIRWGQGLLSYSNLSEAKIVATKILSDGNTLIEMTIDLADGSSVTCDLDPAKDYAATSYTLTSINGKVTCQSYADYKQIDENWIPMTIQIEEYDLETDRLLSSDQWTLTGIDSSVPDSKEFDADYQSDTVVEYHSPLSTKASVYNYSNAVDTDSLLADHLSYVATQTSSKQNCATVALKYAATQLGTSISDDELASLVDSDGQTTLQNLKQLAKGSGLYCQAVTADLTTLSTLSGCQAILHLPGKNHYVVLDRIDGSDAWIVDLSESKFYYRRDKALLTLDWSDGTVLLLSNSPIRCSLPEIDTKILTTLSGGDGWTCSKIIQENYVVFCTLLDSDCTGTFKWYYERWGCEEAESGDCTVSYLARYAMDACYWDPTYGSYGNCTVNGDWIIRYMTACD